MAELFSVEAGFALFLFAGRFKMLPEQSGFPVGELSASSVHGCYILRLSDTNVLVNS